MNTQTITIVYRTPHDVWTAPSAQNAVDWIMRHLTHELSFSEAVDLGSQNGSQVTYADVVQFALDALNDECPIGYWYYLTADANIALDQDDDES